MTNVSEDLLEKVTGGQGSSQNKDGGCGSCWACPSCHVCIDAPALVIKEAKFECPHCQALVDVIADRVGSC